MKKNKGKRSGAFNVPKTERQKRRISEKKTGINKMVMVCKTKGGSCEEQGFPQKVGNVNHLFCCSEGFKYALEEFSKTNS